MQEDFFDDATSHWYKNSSHIVQVICEFILETCQVCIYLATRMNFSLSLSLSCQLNHPICDDSPCFKHFNI